MSTRGAIARLVADGWEGRYHHQDSNPRQLGRTLWALYHGHFAADSAAMTALLLDAHPAGWSTIVDADFRQPAGYRNEPWSPGRGPACYCHGERADGPQLLSEHGRCDEASCNPLAIMWVYVLSAAGMAVLTSRERSAGSQHVPVTFVRWAGAEPDWQALERSGAGA
jgi:hypothetical protein